MRTLIFPTLVMIIVAIGGLSLYHISTSGGDHLAFAQFGQTGNASSPDGQLMPGQQPGFANYQNSTFGISMQYPSSWEQQDFSDGVGFVAPVDNQMDRYKESLDVYVFPKTKTSDTEFVNAILDEIKGLLDFAIAEPQSSTNISNLTAQKLVYTYSDKNIGQVKALSVITTKDDKGYEFRYIAKPADFNIKLPIINKMLDSVVIGLPSGQPGQTIPLGQTGNASAAFNSLFDTYVVPNSAVGYGIYKEHKSNVFQQAEPLVLYLELGNIYHKPVTVAGESMYNMKFSADYVVSAANGTLIQTIPDIQAGDITSHRPNTEVFLTLTLTQNLPPGDYIIKYIVKDDNSGKSFEKTKEVTVSSGGTVPANNTPIDITT